MRLIDIVESPDLRFSKEACLGKPFIVKLKVENILHLVESRPPFGDPKKWEYVTIVYRHESVTKILDFNKLPDPDNWTTALCWDPQDGTESWQPSMLSVGSEDAETPFVLSGTDQRLTSDILVLDP